MSENPQSPMIDFQSHGPSPFNFNSAPQDYEAVRPGYPVELIEDAIRLSAIPQNGRILEIGCGTGQATLPFAQRGYSMLCLDIGSELTAIAAEKCRPYSAVEVRTASFEECEVESLAYNLIMSATAFHWLSPEVAYPKMAKLLKNTGSIALFWNLHPMPYTGFAEAANEVYRQIVPQMARSGSKPTMDQRVRSIPDQIRASGLFGDVVEKQYFWTKTYDRAQYLRLLNTYSDHLNLQEPLRLKLYEALGDLIDREYGGQVERPYLSILYVARKLAHQ